MNDQKSKITFAIPYYSNLAYLKEAINSVIEQDIACWQMVVCDDSVDDSEHAGKLVESIGDARIRYCRNESSLGMAGNWNQCLKIAESGLVTILHADDRLLQNYGTLMLEVADNYPDASAYVCRALTIGSSGKRKTCIKERIRQKYEPTGSSRISLKGEQSLAVLLKGNFIVCPALCYRLELIKGRCFDAKWKQVLDLDFVSRMLLEGEELIFLREQAYAYRRHEDNATVRQTKNLVRFTELIALYDAICLKAREKGWDSAERIALKKTAAKYKLIYSAMLNVLSCNWGNAAQKLSLLSKICRIPKIRH